MLKTSPNRISASRATCLALAMSLAGAPAAAVAGEARRLVLATPDPALFGALSAFFTPRGVDVQQAPRPLQRPGDELRAGDGLAVATSSDLVWLCDVGDGAGGRALCVRPQGQSIVVRRLAMPASPLSSPDAAAVAMSVQVVLLREPGDAPPAAGPAAVLGASVAPAPAAGHAPGHAAHALTFELNAGTRSGPATGGFRGGADVVWAPGRWRHHLGLGAGLTTGTETDVGRVRAPGGGPGPGIQSGPGGGTFAINERDLTLRLFARGQIDVWALRLQLDLGPSWHLASLPISDSDRRDDRYLSLDAAAGAVVPLGRYFFGVRVGGFVLLNTPDRPLSESVGRLGLQGLATAGVGFF